MTPTSESTRIIDARWVISGACREGGMSRVYKGLDAKPEFQGPVAVKISAGGMRGNNRHLALAFDREFRTLQRLGHPNIVELIDAGRDPETDERYFVCPWMENDLQGLLKGDPPAGWDEFWERWGEGILAGLSRAGLRDGKRRSRVDVGVHAADRGLGR